MDTIATIGILGTLILFLHFRLERRFDRLEARIDGRMERHRQLTGGGAGPAA
jgi:hypothetical protein